MEGKQPTGQRVESCLLSLSSDCDSILTQIPLRAARVAVA
jgi:hypothetical protein